MLCLFSIYLTPKHSSVSNIAQKLVPKPQLYASTRNLAPYNWVLRFNPQWCCAGKKHCNFHLPTTKAGTEWGLNHPTLWLPRHNTPHLQVHGNKGQKEKIKLWYHKTPNLVLSHAAPQNTASVHIFSHHFQSVLKASTATLVQKTFW